MKKKTKGNIDSFDKLATLIVGELQDFREEVNERFEKVEERFEDVDRQFEEVGRQFEEVGRQFVSVKLEMRSGFDVTKKIVERHDTRISAVEYKAFGIDGSDTRIKK